VNYSPFVVSIHDVETVSRQTAVDVRISIADYRKLSSTASLDGERGSSGLDTPRQEVSVWVSFHELGIGSKGLTPARQVVTGRDFARVSGYCQVRMQA
jgi:hypothetical protein